MEPLVLDLTGQGIQTTSVADGAQFDYQNNGFEQQMGWVGSGNAFLVYDPSGGDDITGANLFGTSMQLPNGAYAVSGWQALAQFDTNDDGVINSSNAVWSSLYVWENSDGSGTGQLVSLTAAGISGINLTTTASNTIQNGNTIGLTGSFDWASGGTGTMADVTFAADPTVSTPDALISVSSTIAALPDLQGYGTVTTLQQAMQLDTSGTLEGLVEQFIAAGDDTQRLSLVGQIIIQWAGAENVSPTSDGPNFNGQQLAALEQFTGESYADYQGNTDPTAADATELTTAWTQLQNQVYAGLMSQTVLAPLYQAIQLNFDSSGEPYWDFSGAESIILADLSTDPSAALTLLSEFNQTLHSFDLDTGEGYDTFRNDLAAQGSDVAATFLFSTPVVKGDGGDDVIDAWVGNQTVYAGGGASTIIGGGNAETVYGGIGPGSENYDAGSTFIAGPGNEVFWGGGADTFFGGTGTDAMWGSAAPSTFITGSGYDVFWAGSTGTAADPSAGDTFIANGQGGTHFFEGNGQNDTYIYDADSGSVDIEEWGAYGSDVGTLILGPDLTASNVTLTRSGDAITITDGIVGDTIVAYGLAALVFGDGTSLNLTQEQFVSASGNGSFIGADGNADMIGGTGTETLTAQIGNNSFIAGIGSETLIGGSGNDTYEYAQGDGSVAIQDAGGKNTLILGTGLTIANVTLTISGDDLLITDGTSGDQIDIADEFTSSSGMTIPLIQTLVYGDGTVEQLPDVVSDNDATGTLTYTNSVIEAQGTGDMLVGAGAAETLIAGPGDTTLDALYQNENYFSYAAGDGSATIEDVGGDTTLILGSGISAADLQFEASGSNLLITDGVTGDTIDLINQLTRVTAVQTILFSDGTTMNLEGMALTMPSGESILEGPVGNNTLIATTGTETLLGTGSSNDTFIGGSGDQTLEQTGYGNSTFIAGTGTELLIGASGTNTFMYAAGDGLVTITTVGESNTVALGSGITAADVSLTASGNDLLITDGVSGDTITLVEQLEDYDYFPVLTFADGSTQSLDNLALTMPSGASILYSTSGNDTLIATSGTEMLLGNGGSDTFIGGAGVQTLEQTAGDGDNTFIAGTGTETLKGGYGDDTYSYASGDGDVSIVDPSGSNTLVLGSGLTAADIQLIASGTNLLIVDGIAGDTIDLEQQLSSISGAGVQTLVFADGDGTESLKGLALSAPTGAPVLDGTSGDDTLIAGDGTETLLGDGGSDTFIGGVGVQTLEQNAGDGSNTFIAGSGTETLIGNDGSDTFSYAAGDGSVVISDPGTGSSLVLGSGLVAADITFSLSGSSLLIGDGITGDLIDVQGQFTNDSIQTLVFGDGTTIDLPGTKTVVGSAGNDTLIGESVSESTIGITDFETLIGNSGSNTFIAGNGGHQTFQGGSGANVYSYSAGDGADAILTTYGATNTLVLGAGLTAADIAFNVSGDSLLITNGTAGDTIGLLNQYSYGPHDLVQTLVYGDGTTQSLTGGLAIVASGNGSFGGTGLGDTMIGGAGTETLSDSSGSNTFIAGTGPETLNGSTGANVYSYAEGDGKDTIFVGSGSTNTLVLGSGLTAADIAFDVSGNSLLITDGTAGDTIDLLNQYSNGTYDMVQTLVYGDGMTQGLTGALAIVASGNGSFGGTGRGDTMIGGAGTETLSDTSGNNTFISGTGSETLNGSSGVNVYSYAQGDGKDTIFVGYDSTNTLVLGSGLTTADIAFDVSGSSLLITDGMSGDTIDLQNQYQYGTSEAVQTLVYGNGATQSLTGGLLLQASGNGSFGGTGLGDTMIGGTGTETLSDASGNDTFIAGIGSETQQGSNGIDVYSYAQGDGTDTIVTGYGSTNTLDLGSGLTSDDVSFVVSGSSLLITDGATGDTIDLQNQYRYGVSEAVQMLVYSNGVTQSLIDGLAIQAEGNGSFGGTPGNDTIIGGTGTETLNGIGGSDTIIGGTGPQTLTDSGSGSDTFVAGTGTETLEGGSGTNIYSYAEGDGDDTIIQYTGTGTLVLGSDLTAADVGFAVSGNNLLVMDGTVGDTIELYDEYDGATYGAQTLVYGDGTTQSLTGALEIRASGNGSFSGTGHGGDTMIGGTGTETLADTGASDMFIGGAGPETLTDSAAGNTFVGGTGNQLIRGGDDSTYIAGTGTETLEGEGGGNIYSYAAGDGAVTIDQYDAPGTLLLGSGLVAADITFALTPGSDSSALVITDGIADDTIVLPGEVPDSGSATDIETLVYGDGTTQNLTAGLAIAASGNGEFTGTNRGGDTMVGGTGTETLIDNGSNNTFVAGTGTETLEGDAGGNVYSYAAGDGMVTIDQYDGPGTLVLGSGLVAADITFALMAGAGSSALVITDGITGDTIVLPGEVPDSGSATDIETLVYGDGTTQSLTAGLSITASGSGQFSGTSRGGDTMIGSSGTETLIDSGDDNTFIAGTGSQVLYAIGSNNTYVYAQGDGSATVKQFDGTGSTLVLGSSLTAADVTLTVSGDNLFITDGTAGDTLELWNEYGSSEALQTLVYGNGATLNLAAGLPIVAVGNGEFIGAPVPGNTMIGGAGTETLVATSGGGTFIAGTGAETLEGGGNDVYSYNHGNGRDTIIESGGTNTLILGSGLTEGNVSLSVDSANDLIITDGVTGDTITIQHQYSSSSGTYPNEVQTLVYGDGVTQSLSAGLALTGTGSVIYGTPGNDTLIAAAASQTLIGNGGNDTFVASAAGHQTFENSGGNDTYVYTAGDGVDLISGAGGDNTLDLVGTAITSADITLTVSGNNLLITDGIAGDTIDLQSRLTGDSAVQTIAFANGSTMDLSQLVVPNAAGTNVLYGTVGDDTLVASAGAEIVDGFGGGDTFVGAAGTETLYGNQGAAGGNSFIFGQGAATAYGGTGNDTYSYAEGDGADTIVDDGGANTLALGSGLTAADVSFALSANGSNLLISDGVTGDTIDIAGQFSGDAIGTLVFGDGTSISLPTGLTVSAGSGAVTLQGDSNAWMGLYVPETLVGNNAGDTFVAGPGGDETLKGGSGNDVYSYASGDGDDTIVESGGANTLALGSGLTSANVVLSTSGSSLLVTDGVTGDTIYLLYQENGTGSQVQTLIYGNGVSISLTGGLPIHGVGNGSFSGTTGSDTIIGGVGTETLNGDGGSDTIIGGSGAETLVDSGSGNDTFIAGTGTETLEGSTGTDLYSYAQGDGHDTIIQTGGTSTLVLGSGLTASDVVFTVSGNSLLVTDGTTGDTIDLANQYVTTIYEVQTLVYGNGETQSLTGGLSLAASGNGSFTGTGRGDTMVGGTGTETLTDTTGNNTFIAGIGTETLNGGSANDSYSYAQGDGLDTIIQTGGTHTLVLGSGLTASDVVFTVSGNSLLITDGTAGDTIDLYEQYASTVYGVQTLIYGNGTTQSLTGGLPLAASGNGSFAGTGRGGDTMIGGTGTETLTDTTGTNTFIIGVGTETLNGGSANDSYSYAQGDGLDTIIQTGGTHTLTLGSGLTAADVVFKVSGNSLLITDGTAGDTIDLYEQYASTVYGVQTLVYGNGTTQSLTGGLSLAASGSGSFTGTGRGGDTMIGGTGTETLTDTGNGNTFIAGVGAETLNGGSGSDSFIAGAGTETLEGSGSDFYSYAQGDGHDTIIQTGGTSTLELGSGLTGSDVVFTVSGNSLLVTDGTSGDTIDLANQYLATAYEVQTLVYGNGVTQSLTGGLSLAASGNGSFTGTGRGDTMIGGTGTETLTDTTGNNTFIAGIGTETLNGGSANDSYSYAQGDGLDTIIQTGGTHTLVLGSGLTASEVVFTVSGNSLLITDGTAGDTIDLANQYVTAAYEVQTLVYGNGVTQSLTGGLSLAASGNGSFIGTGRGGDTLIGGTGTETLTETAGNNTFIAGTGPETLKGSGGNDVYEYADGDGIDTIMQTNGTNTLVLGSGLTAADMTFAVSGDNLILTDGTAGDTIDLYNQYDGTSFQVQTIVFGTGDTMSLAGAAPYIGTSGSDITGVSGSAVLIAGAGTETLNGNNSNDTFYAGTGTDTLIGGTGNDTYVFFQGMGTSVVNDTGGTNTLRFGEGISDQQLWFAQDGNDLLVSVIGTNESVLVKNWYSGSSPPSDTFVDGNGDTLQTSQVANLVNAMASYTPPAEGQTTLPSNEATTLDPVIAANWQAA